MSNFHALRDNKEWPPSKVRLLRKAIVIQDVDIDKVKKPIEVPGPDKEEIFNPLNHEQTK